MHVSERFFSTRIILIYVNCGEVVDTSVCNDY